MTSQPIRVLFVCLGNICRSPLAEGLFHHFVREAGLTDRFHVDSAGTSDWHERDRADPRTIEVAKRHGIVLTSRSRPIRPVDLTRFEYVLAMDAQNLADIRAMARDAGVDTWVRRIREFDPDANGDLDVPDPFYDADRGFERVQEIVTRSARGLLEHIRAERGV